MVLIRAPCRNSTKAYSNSKSILPIRTLHNPEYFTSDHPIITNDDVASLPDSAAEKPDLSPQKVATPQPPQELALALRHR